MVYFNPEAIAKIRNGYYSAVYFNRTKEILLGEKNFKSVVMQVFQRKEGSVLCGVEEVRELLRVGSGYYQQMENRKLKIENRERKNKKGGSGKDISGVAGWSETEAMTLPNVEEKEKGWIDKSDEIKIESLKDGDEIAVCETVMHIKGPYVYFAHLESIYLGILARRTLVATNVRKAVNAASGKPVIFFADRFDHFYNQEGDGYAAKVGGADGVCTEAQTAWTGGKPSGTIPHALIAMYGGDSVKATELFDKYRRSFLSDINVIALVDFENDCVKTSLEVARKLGKRLWGVRLDTSSDLVDKSLEKIKIKYKKEKIQIKNQKYSGKDTYGVNPLLVKKVRESLDSEGFKWVKIVVSGGFDAKKIRWFEKEKAAVDVYGVGSAMVKGENDFTADIVEVEGKRIAKVGREYKEIENSK